MLRGGLGEQPPGDPAPRRGPWLRNGFENNGETGGGGHIPDIRSTCCDMFLFFDVFWREEGPPVSKEMEWSWTYNSKPLKCGKNLW